MVWQDTADWWALLRTLAVFNVLAWLAVAAWAPRRGGCADTARLRRWQLLLSAGYVLGCAWRSWLPVFDVPRLVLVDSVWSSVIVGRSVATVAELCFAAQWALLLRALSARAASLPALTLARAVLPLIAVAELCSWHAVLTTSNAGHVLEESLWGVCAVLVAASAVLLAPRLERVWRRWLALLGVAAVGYALYLFGVDVPTYWSRWVADAAAGHRPLGLAEGVADAATRWVVSHRWEQWRGESVWMTAYFSLGVWLSLALVLVPTLRRRGAQAPSGAPIERRGSRGWLRRAVSASDR